MALNHDLSNQFPLKQSPLVQCITNEITCESMANALLYVGAKPIMADDSREFKQLFTQTDALFLNLGHLSEKRQISLLEASRYAKETKKPTVVDQLILEVLDEEERSRLYKNFADHLSGVRDQQIIERQLKLFELVTPELAKGVAQHLDIDVSTL